MEQIICEVCGKYLGRAEFSKEVPWIFCNDCYKEAQNKEKNK